MITAPPIPEVTEASSRDAAGFARGDLDRMIAEAAYYLAQQRGFEPGHEVDDWLQAEAQIFDQLAASAR